MQYRHIYKNQSKNYNRILKSHKIHPNASKSNDGVLGVGILYLLTPNNNLYTYKYNAQRKL